MKNSCRPNDSDMIEFTVTADHITLLKNLNMKISTFIYDRLEYGSYFQNCPAVDTKRPFGNSGDPAWEALHTLKIKPAGRDEAYSEEQLNYGRYLILSLPLAYDAVMDHGVIEPCVGHVSRFSGAGFSFQHRRVLEYWRDAINEACKLDGVVPDQLITLLTGVGRAETPVAPVFDILRTMRHCPWAFKAMAVLSQHAVRNYKALHPEASGLDDDEILSGLRSGKYAITWADTLLDWPQAQSPVT